MPSLCYWVRSLGGRMSSCNSTPFLFTVLRVCLAIAAQQAECLGQVARVGMAHLRTRLLHQTEKNLRKKLHPSTPHRMIHTGVQASKERVVETQGARARNNQLMAQRPHHHHPQSRAPRQS